MSEHPLLLVCNKHDDTMSFVDAETLAVIETIPVGPNPHEIIVTPDRRTAYLSNYRPPGDSISVVDLVARRHIGQISTGEYTRIHGAAIMSDGCFAYFTAGQTGCVVEIDISRNIVTRAISTFGEISHMNYLSPDDTLLYTANIVSEDVSVLDRISGKLLQKIPCGSGVEGMAFTPDGRELWALNQTGDSIDIIALPSHEVIERVECPGMPVRCVFSPNGDRVYIPSWTENGELIVMDTATRKEITRIPVGSQAIGVVISPDGRRVFVGCEHTDGVHVIDTEALDVVGVIHTGDGSDAMAYVAA